MVKRHCCVTGCYSSSDKWDKLDKYPGMRNIDFFYFPKDTREKSIWVNLIRRKDFKPSRWTTVCSRHFVDRRPTENNPRPELFPYNNYKESVKPRSTAAIQKRNFTRCEAKSILKPQLRKDIRPPSNRVIRLIKVETHKGDVASYETTPEKSDENIDDPMIRKLVEDGHPTCKIKNSDGDPDPAPHISLDHAYVRYDEADRKYDQGEPREMATQTDLTWFEIELMEKKCKENLREAVESCVQESEENVKFFTGLPSKDTLLGIFSVIEPVAKYARYWKGEKNTATSECKSDHKKPGPPRKLSLFSEFLLTLIWLRLALPGPALCNIFAISEGTLSSTLTTWVHILYQTLTPTLLPWPSKEEVKSCMPGIFKRKNFGKTRVVIDCTEFFVQRPHDSDAQYKTYSSYKSHNTFKVLVGVTPTGAFSFISNVWTGNVSDKYITRESGLIDLLEKNDRVMADRGFQIEDLLLKKKAKLIAPPFTRKCLHGKGKRLTAREIRTTRDIACVRIHVERGIRRLKSWRILSETIPLHLSPIISEIVKVIAGFCNLLPPLVKDD